MYKSLTILLKNGIKKLQVNMGNKQIRRILGDEA